VQPAFVVPAALRPAILAAVLALSAAPSGTAFAQSEMIDNGFGFCDFVDCSVTTFAGWVGSSGGQVQPWTGKVFAVAGNCLRIGVSFIGTSAANLETVVVAPNGTSRYRNDQGGIPSCTNCPLVKIDPAPATGFYTVVVSTNNAAAVDSVFHFGFGHYPTGNTNCAAPTPALP
jgi:hypothetical protein